MVLSDAKAAIRLQQSIGAFLEAPNMETLKAAKQAWLDGREVFGKTEVLRFSSGPIDDRRIGVETYLNAWPLDEAYIDAVRALPSMQAFEADAVNQDFDFALDQPFRRTPA